MLFNSIEYFLFLPIIFLTYWFLFNRYQKAQTFFLLIASYFFYGFWDYRFLGLIFLSTNLDFFLAQLIFKEKKITRKKLLLNISLFFNLGLLGVFKYFNFFIFYFLFPFSFFNTFYIINFILVIVNYKIYSN